MKCVERVPGLICNLCNVVHAGSVAVVGGDNQHTFMSSTELDFILDDVGCTGAESNILECLPDHNCGTTSIDENAGVRCLRKGTFGSHS